MYNTYNIDETITDIYVVGDLHGLFPTFKYKIRESKIENGLIIVAGDCGFGFEKEEYYKQVYKRMKKVLLKQNVHIVFVRGNHDQKSYFDGEKINFPNFLAVPDYSVLKFTTDTADVKNILCVGGAISIDRRYRKNEQSKYTNGKKLYWEDEFPIYEPLILDEIKNDGVNIDVLITHTSPSFAPLTDKVGIENWIYMDPSLNEDLSYERLTINKIYDHLVKKDKHPLKINIYGHFHQHRLSYSDEDVKFIMLDMFGEHNNSWDIYQIRF